MLPLFTDGAGGGIGGEEVCGSGGSCAGEGGGGGGGVRAALISHLKHAIALTKLIS